MVCSLSLLVVALGTVSAAAVRRQTAPCLFSITVSGGHSGHLSDDTTGEVQVSDDQPQMSFFLTGNNLSDSGNNPCLLDPSTAQLQCAPGMLGATNFSLADNGDLLHNGSVNWLACPVDGSADNGIYNIFSYAKANTGGCLDITLVTGGFSCAHLGTPTTSTTSASPSAVCPTDISSGNFQFPHLIVPTSSQSPEFAFGNSYTAHISNMNTTLFNFDIPPTDPYLGTCALLFLFPYASSLDQSAGIYKFSGIEEEEDENGGLAFALLGGIATDQTTYTTTPSVQIAYGNTRIIPGNPYTIAIFPCPSGERVTYQVNSTGNVELDYFQDSKASAIGLYIVPCS